MEQQFNDVSIPSQNLVGPGARLRHAREALSMTIEDIANFLHLRPQLIEEIEVDDYRSVRQRVFLIGYLRSYAKQVQLVPDEIIRLFKEISADPIATVYPAPVMRVPQLRGVKKSSMPRLANMVIILGGVILMSIWWHNLKSAHTEHVAPIVTAVKPLASVDTRPVLAPVAVAQDQPVVTVATRTTEQGNVARDFDLPAAQHHNVPWTELQ